MVPCHLDKESQIVKKRDWHGAKRNGPLRPLLLLRKPPTRLTTEETRRS